MNYMLKIININAYIQRGMGKITLDGKEVLCISLDRTCTFEAIGVADVILDDDQLETLWIQAIPSVNDTATSYEIGSTSSHNPLSGASQEQLYRKKFLGALHNQTYTPSEVVE